MYAIRSYYEVAAPEEKLGQHQATLLAAGQPLHRPVVVILAEQEKPERGHELLLCAARVREASHLREDRARKVQKLGP